MNVPQLAGLLVQEVAGYGPTLVLFSGGVDSALVVAAAARGLGAANVTALTAVSPAVPGSEVDAAARLCAALGVDHETVTTAELDVEGYRRNGPDRCAFCKSTLMGAARPVADRLHRGVVATGTNASDIVAGFRPGIAAAAKRGAHTPLADLGIDKATVRAIAKAWRLPVWDKPAAACLASRVAFGLEITPARLARIEQAERSVRDGCAQAGIPLQDLRVRDLGSQVRVEVDQEHVAAVSAQDWLAPLLRTVGFDQPIATEPFRSGAMNELLAEPEKWRRR